MKEMWVAGLAGRLRLTSPCGHRAWRIGYEDVDLPAFFASFSCLIPSAPRVANATPSLRAPEQRRGASAG